MNEYKEIHELNEIEHYSSIMEKLTVNPQLLTSAEKTFILTCAIILIKKFEKDRRCTSYMELAYYIILKYSLSFSDYEPLYDFSVNVGFYPIAQSITSRGLISFDNIPFSLLPHKISSEYANDLIIETLEQKITRNRIIASSDKEISYIAPTSFGKSSIIIDHIVANKDKAKRIGIIVPTKSLLMQTYRSIRKAKLGYKILIHDEMFNGEQSFIAIFTQERALRLLDKHNIFFDTLYIDEAHRLLEEDSRSILLSRLIKINRLRNKESITVYLSPLISNTENLKVFSAQNIFEQRITFNIKEPEYYEYRLDGDVLKYNRFVDRFFKIGYSPNIFDYINNNSTEKTFCYLYSPRKIEKFAKELSSNLEELEITEGIKEIIGSLRRYVHEDFYEIEYIQKGIVYLHGKLPDNVKDYLEYKFNGLSEIHFLIANKVILEGINLPIDSLFILNGTKLNEKELTNLIGRVNRLDQIFGEGSQLKKLLPVVHFVNHQEYNRKNSKLENKIRLLKTGVFHDDVNNPILTSFNFKSIGEKKIKKFEQIIADEAAFFTVPKGPVEELKRKMISLGMNTIYSINDNMCVTIYKNITELMMHPKLDEVHFLDKLSYLFIKNLTGEIIDKEFLRLKNEKAIAYYKMFFDNRKNSLKENITLEVKYFYRRIETGDSLMYIGESFGEMPYASEGRGAYNNVYINLSTMSRKQLVNIAVIKQKLEQDFVSYKLHMFFQLMFDYGLLSKDEYNNIIYGSTDPQKLQLVKMGLTINLINRLDKDGQLENIMIDDNNNLYGNYKLEEYKRQADDFYRFELSKFL